LVFLPGEDGARISVMINRNFEVIGEFKEEQELVYRYREQIEDLFQRAEKKWNTKFE